MRPVPLLRPSYFIWPVVPILFYGAYLILGDPYLIWSWRAYPSGVRPAPFFGVSNHIDCTYVGWRDGLLEPAHDGRCSIIRFSKEHWT